MLRTLIFLAARGQGTNVCGDRTVRLLNNYGQHRSQGETYSEILLRAFD